MAEEKFAEQNAQVFAEMKPQRKDDAVCFSATQQDESEEEWRLKPSRFSKWYGLSLTKRLKLGLSLVRVTAWVHRFIANCRKSKKERVSGELTANELQGVEEIIIREAQMEVYCQEITALKEKKSLHKRSSILNLTPIWKDGLLLSNTRLRYSEDLSEEIKYPIILPKRHPVTKLIVKYHHESEGHRMGVNFTLNHLRERYHVVHGREMVKRTAKECTTCKRRFTGKPGVQQMAPLPNIRLELTMKPFTNCAVDFAGPYLTKQGRGKTRTKRYLCLFLCLQTHCCHLEMAWSLETDGFLQAFTRMVARRGWPRTMLSDNGTNFVHCKKS